MRGGATVCNHIRTRGGWGGGWGDCVQSRRGEGRVQGERGMRGGATVCNHIRTRRGGVGQLCAITYKTMVLEYAYVCTYVRICIYQC